MNHCTRQYYYGWTKKLIFLFLSYFYPDVYRSIYARGYDVQANRAFAIHVDSDAQCVSLKLKLEGGGFSFFKFTWYVSGSAGEEFYRLYPRHFVQKQWRTVRLPVHSVRDVSFHCKSGLLRWDNAFATFILFRRKISFSNPELFFRFARCTRDTLKCISMFFEFSNDIRKGGIFIDF